MPRRGKVEAFGYPILVVARSGEEQDAGPGTDFDAIRRGAVSVTPLQIDLTSYKSIDGVANWLLGASS